MPSRSSLWSSVLAKFPWVGASVPTSEHSIEIPGSGAFPGATLFRGAPANGASLRSVQQSRRAERAHRGLHRALEPRPGAPVPLEIPRSLRPPSRPARRVTAGRQPPWPTSRKMPRTPTRSSRFCTSPDSPTSACVAAAPSSRSSRGDGDPYPCARLRRVSLEHRRLEMATREGRCELTPGEGPRDEVRRLLVENFRWRIALLN